MDNHSLKLPERLRPSKACSHKSTIWKEDLVSCNPSNQSSKTPSRPSKRSLMSEEWARSEHPSSETTSLTLIYTKIKDNVSLYNCVMIPRRIYL